MKATLKGRARLVVPSRKFILETRKGYPPTPQEGFSELFFCLLNGKTEDGFKNSGLSNFGSNHLQMAPLFRGVSVLPCSTRAFFYLFQIPNLESQAFS